jgi:hypothetical protein
MNRSVRYGLSIAGMAGGIFFLGQAAAQATDQSNVNTAEQGASTEAEHSSSDAENVSVDLQANVADQSTKIVNAPDQISSASNSVSVSGLPSGGPAKVIIVDDSITQNATSTISGGNQTVAEVPTPAAVSQSNVNNVEQAAKTESDEGHKGPWGPPGGSQSLASFGSGGPGGPGGGSDAENTSFNGQLNLYDGSTTIINKPEQTSSASNDVNLDFSNATFYCGDEQMSLTSQDPKKCEYLIVIKGLEINQNATSVISGGNQVIGSPAKPEEHHQKAPEQKAVAPAHHAAAAPVSHKAAPAALSSAQPASGTLAFTGAETSAPLTLGLLALGAGGALTLAGRRRTATAAV